MGKDRLQVIVIEDELANNVKRFSLSRKSAYLDKWGKHNACSRGIS